MRPLHLQGGRSSLIAVVMAGGNGTRLWPASRSRRPKQFLELAGGRSLLAATLSMLDEYLRPDGIAIVANPAHREYLEALGGKGHRIIWEPVGRGTAPCLGLAALYLGREEPDEVLVALPADNLIADGREFAMAMRRAASLAGSGGIAAIGTPPSRPAVEFGYLLPGPPLPETPPLGPPAFTMAGFVEKPDPAQAAELCAGGWLWNAGVFAFRPAELAAEIRRLQPALAAALARVAEALDSPDRGRVIAGAWRELPEISMDEGIMARGPRRALVVRSEHRWSDLGGWDAVRQQAAPSAWEQAGRTLAVRSRDSLIWPETSRFVALVGLDGVTVVDTPDALLVLGPGHSQDMREVAAYLRENRPDLL